MTPQNAQGLLSMPDIDGGLVGRASLTAKDFVTICQTAENIADDAQLPPKSASARIC